LGAHEGTCALLALDGIGQRDAPSSTKQPRLAVPETRERRTSYPLQRHRTRSSHPRQPAATRQTKTFRSSSSLPVPNEIVMRVAASCSVPNEIVMRVAASCSAPSETATALAASCSGQTENVPASAGSCSQSVGTASWRELAAPRRRAKPVGAAGRDPTATSLRKPTSDAMNSAIHCSACFAVLLQSRRLGVCGCHDTRDFVSTNR
jgi:hypothetical protein